jgi:fucose 4-O-acetylase-like acetyltransferase
MDRQSLTSFYAGFITFGLIFSSLTLAYSVSTQQAWALPSGDAILTFFPSNAPFLVAAMTGVLLFWSTSLRFLSQAKLLAQTGRVSLTVYVAHFVPFALFHTIDQTNDWSLTQSSTVVFAYTVGWIVVGSIWYKTAPKATLEHLMRLSAGASEDTPSVSLNETE